jgi:hypothetical protein
VSKPWNEYMGNDPWCRFGVTGDTVLEFTREPRAEFGTGWCAPLKTIRPEMNVVGLYWREAPGHPLPTPTKKVNARDADALGEPLRAGEMYVSSKHGLIPVSVEGVRFLIDKGEGQ